MPINSKVWSIGEIGRPFSQIARPIIKITKRYSDPQRKNKCKVFTFSLFNSVLMNQSCRCQEHVDQFDADKGGDQSTQAIDQQVIA